MTGLSVPRINLNNESSINDSILGIPFSKVITLGKPIFNWASGIMAAWFIAKVNLLGIHGFDQSNVQTYVGAGLTFVTVTGLQQLGDLKWIKGHHIELGGGRLGPLLNAAVDELDDPELDLELESLDEAPSDDATTLPPDAGDAGGGPAQQATPSAPTQ